MDEGKKIKMHFGSDKDKEIKVKKEKGHGHWHMNNEEEKDAIKEGSAGEPSEAETTETPSAAQPEDWPRLLKEKEEELHKEHDRLLRAVAEHENYKKRVAREKADSLKFSNESLIRELLPVLDNLELSLEHARNSTSTDAIIDGVELIKKEFLRKLEKFGLTAISAQGEKFDPTKHEATAQVETSQQPENTVVHELQKGYFIHDRLLRPARVTVAKSPKPPED